MFAKSRRPVPSTAALRILRQLAYISSGTACGAAAIIAEERRRQTRLAKKVVENSRKLKQHPRYAHSTTEPRPNTSFFVTENFMTENEEQDQAVGKSSENGTKSPSHRGSHLVDQSQQDVPSRVRPESDAFRNELLPSEVEKGYRKYAKRQRSPQNLSRNRDESEVQAQQSRSRRHDLASYIPATSLSDHKTTQDMLIQRLKIGINSDLGSGNHENAYHRLHHYAKHNKALQRPLEPELVRHSSSPPYQEPALLGPDAPSLLAVPSSPTLEDLDRQTTAFLTLYPSVDSPSDVQLVLLASRILDVATRVGSLDAVRDIATWLLRAEQLDANRVKAMCVNSSVVLSKSDPEVACAFYTELLLDERLQSLKEINLCRLIFTASLLDADLPMGTAQRQLVPLDETREGYDPSEDITECCRALLESHRHRAAVRLLRYCLSKETINVAAFNVLTKEIFEQCLQLDDFKSCAEVLQCTHGSPDFTSHLSRLILECKDRGADAILVQLHKCYGSQHKLPEAVYPALCSAYAKASNKKAAAFFMRHIQRPMDDSILAACQPAWAELLERKWNDTRNLQHVERVFSKLRLLAGRGNIDIALYNTMIGACVQAGKTHQAENFLRQMQDEEGIQPDLTTFGHFLLSAAKARDWNGVESLLNMLDDVSMADVSPAHRIDVFNPVLSEYVRHHQPAQIWTFASAAFETHGILPNQRTNDIVFESFVHGRRLDLVPRWLFYVQTCGGQARLSPRTVLRMLRRYYYDTRPSHVVMMWLCRNLIHSESALQTQDMDLLLRESIGYDMRQVGGPQKSRLFQLAHARLKILENNPGHVPLPRLRSDPLQEKPGSDSLPGSPLYQEYADKRHIENDILLSLSLGQHSDAVVFYKQSLAASGLPYSSLSLEMAITASLRAQHGDPMEAEELLNAAQEANLNTSAALMPLMLERIKNAGKYSQTLEPEELGKTMVDFYCAMDKNGIPVRHHLATTAAHVLISHSKAEQGISLLRTVLESPSSSLAPKPLDIAAMTVFFQGYAKIEHEAGMEWTVNTILEQNIRIDATFSRVLAQCKRDLRLASNATSETRYLKLAKRVEGWRETCMQRQDEQIREATNFGNQLVRCIVKSMSRDSPVDSSSPPHAEKKHIEPESPIVKVELPSGRIVVKSPGKIAYKALLRRGVKDESGRRMKFRYVAK
ncbi:hypothetical protein BDV97DRAFT_362073 [Delphinella strobiligena]|nr:hypothetical protein BDV97DRAFT_362073 [Delphinella strobiligena]